jgi:hypothetical protein
MPVYTGKFNYSPYASNENIIVDFPDGWVTHGRARVWSTWTKDASGVEKSLAFGPALTSYVLRNVSDGATTFMIRDLDDKNYYWFTGTRKDDTITLLLKSQKGANVEITLKLFKSS